MDVWAPDVVPRCVYPYFGRQRLWANTVEIVNSGRVVLHNSNHHTRFDERMRTIMTRHHGRRAAHPFATDVFAPSIMTTPLHHSPDEARAEQFIRRLYMADRRWVKLAL
jgi:hypothetical protein